MKATVLDGFSRDLGDGSRGAALSASSAAWPRSARWRWSGAMQPRPRRASDATRGASGSRGDGGQTPGGQNECVARAPVAQLSVPGDGTSVQDVPVLAQGQAYLFQVTGAAATNGEASVDAEYGFPTADPNNITPPSWMSPSASTSGCPLTTTRPMATSCRTGDRTTPATFTSGGSSARGGRFPQAARRGLRR